MRRTIYYKDMLNDDFADNGIKRKKLPRDYQYISKDPLRKTADFMLHHFVATPIAYIFQKVVYREKIVNRKVLENCGVDPDKYTGFAFGLGLDRIAMLKNGVNNIHVLYEGDLRALKQFKD